jgi:5S rRNA maturation endonuclease (ribonuclease M5)
MFPMYMLHMRQTILDDAIVDRLQNIVEMLNEESECGSIIVVEGKRDANALASIGFKGKSTLFNTFKGVTDFVDSHSMVQKKIILLFDMDRTGKRLTSELMTRLQLNGNQVSLFYKSALARIGNGKIRHIEDLSGYRPFLLGIVGNRRDLHFYL